MLPLTRIRLLIRRTVRCFPIVIVIQETVFLFADFPARHGVQTDGVNRAEHVLLYIGVRFPERFQQLLDFRALRVADAIAAFVALFGQAAGAGDKVQGVEIAPSADVFLVDAVHWANQLHAGKIAAVQLRQHGLQLGTVEHTHDGRLHNIVEVMTECDFVAAHFLRTVVKETAAHPGAEVAGISLGDFRCLENAAVKNADGDFHQGGIVDDTLAVFGIVAGIHDEKLRLEGNVGVALQQLHHFRQQHGVLAAGNAHRNVVAGSNHLVLLDAADERPPERFAEIGEDAALDACSRG